MTVVTIACGSFQSFALHENGQVYSWEYNAIGKITKVEIPTSNKIVEIACGSFQSLALDDCGQVYAWKDNASTTVYTVLHDKHIVGIACGYDHSLAIDNLGHVYAWGCNYFGQLGNNSTTYQSSPTNISCITNSSLYEKSIGAIACGSLHSLALDSDGQVHAWGCNHDGQLGNNTKVGSQLPIHIPFFENKIIAIACGFSHSVALDINGDVYAWGLNSFGQLGNDTTIESMVPIKIPSIRTKIVAIACGGNHTILLDINGKVHACGHNGYGQLGCKTLIVSCFSPFIMPINEFIVAIACGSGYTLALDVHGNFHAFGQQ